jgi:MFS family permease
MELSILVFEIPTGIVADAVSRRRSVLLGTTLMGVALVLTGVLPSFPALLGAQALWGLGYAFTSGATEAWVAGEVGDQAVGPLFLRAAQYASPAAALGVGLSVGWPTWSSGSRWWPPVCSNWCWPAGWPWPCQRRAFGPSRTSSGRPTASSVVLQP